MNWKINCANCETKCDSSMKWLVMMKKKNWKFVIARRRNCWRNWNRRHTIALMQLASWAWMVKWWEGKNSQRRGEEETIQERGGRQQRKSGTDKRICLCFLLCLLVVCVCLFSLFVDAPDPIQEDGESNDDADAGDYEWTEESEQTEQQQGQQPRRRKSGEGKGYDYLLSMPIWSLTLDGSSHLKSNFARKSKNWMNWKPKHPNNCGGWSRCPWRTISSHDGAVDGRTRMCECRSQEKVCNLMFDDEIMRTGIGGDPRSCCFCVWWQAKKLISLNLIVLHCLSSFLLFFFSCFAGFLLSCRTSQSREMLIPCLSFHFCMISLPLFFPLSLCLSLSPSFSVCAGSRRRSCCSS